MGKKRLPKPHSRGVKVLVVSLGCAKNLVDTEVMCGNLASKGFILTNVAKAADITLINTCSFIQDARTESAEAIQQALAWRQNKRSRRLVVTGCWAQQEAEQLLSDYPCIDLLLGLDEVPVVAEHLTALMDAGTGGVKVSISNPTYLYDHEAPRLQLTPSVFAYVKIAEGCNHGCSFCSIPAIRGPLRSRTLDSVVEECRVLLANGVRELNLIGQDVTAYGRDRGERDALLGLIDSCETLSGDFWLRLLYTHPVHVSDGLLVRLNRQTGHLLPYLDMPLQHIDEAILKSMGRGMGEAATRRLLTRIREQCPELILRTTFMVGYPGETEAAFGKLVDLIRNYRFHHAGVFIYSPEPGTRAAACSGQTVDSELAKERKEILLREQQKISAEINQSRLGTIVPVLIEGSGDDGFWRGRTAGDAPEVDGAVFFTGGKDCRESGIVNVKITDADIYDLFGEAVAGM